MRQPQSTDTLREWSDSAKYWAKHSETIRRMFAPLTRALIEDAGIVPGQAVLDVAGGTGEPSLAFAEVVGPTGSVTCTDAIDEMVRAAEREAVRRKLTNITFRHCTADSLPFSDNKFDATVSRLGVMFFPDPLNALRETLRVTKPGGSLAFVVWDSSDVNPFLNVVTGVLSRYVETAEADEDAPGAFRFAERGKLARILSEAGGSEVRERILKFQIAAPLSFEEFWELRSEVSATLRDKLQTLSPTELNHLRADVEEASREYFTSGGMSFPAQMIIVSGRKSTA